MKTTMRKIVSLSCSLIMLVATLLLPLVNLKSYRWGFFELFHKIDRLVGSATHNIIGKTMLVVLLAGAVITVLSALLKGRVPKSLALLPLLVAFVFIVVLFTTGRTAPGIGLWIYVIAAAITFGMTFKN